MNPEEGRVHAAGSQGDKILAGIQAMGAIGHDHQA
jgi:hypothetical protein